MKPILSWCRDYFLSVNKTLLSVSLLLVATLVWINYSFRLEVSIRNLPGEWEPVLGHFFLYTFVFSLSYVLLILIKKDSLKISSHFVFLLLVCPALYSVKTSWSGIARLAHIFFADPWNRYMNSVLDWSLKCLALLLLIRYLWKKGGYGNPVAGMDRPSYSFRPYWLMLVCMVPVVLLVSFFGGFSGYYPRVEILRYLKPYTGEMSVWRILYELAYGTDFFSVELFFRGLLVLGFVRYAGRDAILPMACFYCIIHFGKPWLECVSSFPGGILLGIIVYHSGSIWGGLLVHLGLAWMMEAAGLLARFY